LAESVTADEAVLIENAKSRGIENPEALLADYKRIVDRWAALLADVDHGDTYALAALAKAEIYDKLDRANYGMN
ncbi:MAG: C4-dicarboxylate ABC transporter substrate-binding protein, partial [Sulfitobacter sp.]|nr:C4-dicarboxylate ABC transporter substrate-binding protein [Sulfitobacter sp.]